MAKFIPVGTFDIVIFGATGDLSERKLLPALFHRWLDGQIPKDSRIIGSARSEMDAVAFRAFAEKACKKSDDDRWDQAAWAEFAKCLNYVAMDATKTQAPWRALKKTLSGESGRPCVFYLATAPRLYVGICEALGKNDLNGPDVRCLLYTSPSPRDKRQARMPSSA